jgi:hypothetical protein
MQIDSRDLQRRQPGLLEREVEEFVAAWVSPAIPKEFGELIRIDFNVSNSCAAAGQLPFSLRNLIGPSIDAGGKVRIDDTPEGIVVFGLDLGEIE